VAIDRAAAYASAIRTPDLMLYATIVVDHLHMVKLANDALTKVRRRVTWDLHDRRGPKIGAEWDNRRGLLTARNAYRPRASTRRGTQSGPRTPAPRS
jgi:transposase